MGSHIVEGEFQSDKYPTCPPGKVPLSVKDKTAQDLLWAYAQRRRAVDAEFSDDLEAALKAKGFRPPTPDDNARFAEIRELRAKITPGEWTCERDDHDSGEIYFAIHGGKYEFITNVYEIKNKANADFIAKAPRFIDTLFAEIARLKEQSRAYKSAMFAITYLGDGDEVSEARVIATHALEGVTPDDKGLEVRAVAWLIERDGMWWGPPCSRWEWTQRLVTPELWTDDANQAVRFARKEDAEHAMRWEGLRGGALATEHVWIGGTPARLNSVTPDDKGLEVRPAVGEDSEQAERAAIFKAIAPYREQINSTPALLSVLYDVDLLPEQVVRPVNATRMSLVCEMFKRLTPEAIKELFYFPAESGT